MATKETVRAAWLKEWQRNMTIAYRAHHYAIARYIRDRYLVER